LGIFNWGVRSFPAAAASGDAHAEPPSQQAESRSSSSWDAWVAGEDAPSRLGKVTPEQAPALSTVFASVSLIAGALAATPLCVYTGQGRSRHRVSDSPLCGLLNRQPNPTHTAYDVMHFLAASVLLAGNGYAQIQRVERTGEPVAILPLIASTVTPRPKNSSVVYDVRDPATGVLTTLPATEVLHIRRLSPLHTLIGKSPITTVAGTFKSAKAIEEHTESFFVNGARPGIALVTGTDPGPDERANAAKKLRAQLGGRNAFTPIVLGPGSSIQPFSIDPDSLQLLESRKFSREQIAEVFNVPPQLLGIPGKNISSTEQASLQFNQYTLRPWMACIEQALTAALLPDVPDAEIAFDRTDLQVMDTDAITKLISVTKQNGIRTANEWRLRLGEEASEDEHADGLFHQLNLTPLDPMTAPQGPGAPILRSVPVAQPPPSGETRAVESQAQTLDDLARGAESGFRAVALDLLALERDMISGASSIATSDPAVLDVMQATARPAVARAIRPGLDALANSVLADIEADIEPDRAREVRDNFLPNFVESAAQRWLTQSGGFGLDDEDRADSFSRRESRQLTYALAREVWRAAGVPRLEWQARGESEQDQGLDEQSIDLQADERFQTADGRAFRNPPIGRASFGIIGPQVTPERETE